MKIPRQAYTLEFKQGAVQRVKGGELVSKVAKELGLIEQTLRNWVKAADRGELKSKVKAGLQRRRRCPGYVPRTPG